MTRPTHETRPRNVGEHTHHFHGGLRLRHNKKISCQDPVIRPGLPKKLIVPLMQHAGELAQALVSAGDRVLKGETIGQCPSSVTIHSPVSGAVESIEKLPMTHPSGLDGNCIVIRPDNDQQWTALEPVDNWQNADPQQLIEKIQPLSGDPTVIFKPEARGTLPLTPEYLQLLEDAMISVVEDRRGTANFRLRGYNIPTAAKTGTAETDGVPHAWFAGYAPAGSPQYSFVVVLENGGSGSRAAGPIARELMKTMLELNLLGADREPNTPVLAN